MAMTLRLSEKAEARLEELTADGASKTAIIEQALENFDEHARHRAIVRAAADRVRTEDAELLRLLAE